MANNGWIRLHRKIKDHRLWPRRRRYTPLEAWLDLLLDANHSHDEVLLGTTGVITIERGQVLTSQVGLSKRWKWHRETTIAFLKQLKALQMLDIQTSKQTSTGYTLLTIQNYGRYQDIKNVKKDESDIETDIQPTSNRHPPYTNNNVKNEKKKEEGHELHRSSLPPAPPQPGKNGNGKDWGKRDWIPFFLHNQDYVPLPIEHFLTPQWWHNLFEQYPRQIGPGTLERVFAFMGRHFIEQPSKRPKSKKGYLQKTANLIRIQLERDERANGDRTDLSWLEPQSDFLKKYFAERSSSEGS